jgi:hypothetical protein
MRHLSSVHQIWVHTYALLLHGGMAALHSVDRMVNSLAEKVRSSYQGIDLQQRLSVVLLEV